MANEQVEVMGDEQQAFVLVLWADDEHQCHFNSTSAAQHHFDSLSVNKCQWGTANNVSQPVEDSLVASLITTAPC